MAVITPNTDVILLKVPLEISDSNQLTFANATAQYNYFYGLPKLAFDKFTYQRKDNTIRVGALIDDLYAYNYVMYRNTNHSNKWFYAYITDLQYVSDQVTAISIKTDVWQTYQFDLTYKKVFVEREHVNDDSVGANLVPEGLETGEYVANGTITLTTTTTFPTMNQNGVTCNFGLRTPRYVINSIYSPDDATILGTNLNGVPISGGIFVFDSWQSMVNNIQKYSNNSHLEQINQCWIVPYNTFNDNDLTVHGTLDEDLYYTFNGKNTSEKFTKTFSMPSTIDGYTPRNKKLLTSDYQYLLLTNNNGSSSILNYEYFSNTASIQFECNMNGSVGGSIFICPLNYKDIPYNYNEGIMAGKYPTLSWSGDSYTNWLTQNAVNISAGVISDVARLPLIPYNPAVGTASLLSSVLGQVSEIRKHALSPYTSAGNTNGGDVMTGSRINDCYVFEMSITQQFARKIDQYFDMFGYKVNEVKIPNITGRTNWNYVKTIGCYIKADIPQDDLDEIKSLFDKGITFWHNPSTFMDYSQSNAIVS